MRIALGIEYDGASYVGWQTQTEAAQVNTLQDCLEQALGKIANHKIVSVCCGRTDAGVHAVQQIVHFDTVAQRPLQAWVRGLNSLLPKQIRICWALPTSDEFHARHSALERRYTYALLSNSNRPALMHQQVGWVHYPLNLAAMQQAAQSLLGEHDFSSFRASECQARTPIRTITQFQIEQYGDIFLFHIQANAFLQHMIRNVVGSLVYVGIEKWGQAEFARVLAAKDRRQGAPTFSADGLYFCGAIYPEKFAIPKPVAVRLLLTL